MSVDDTNASLYLSHPGGTVSLRVDATLESGRHGSSMVRIETENGELVLTIRPHKLPGDRNKGDWVHIRWDSPTQKVGA